MLTIYQQIIGVELVLYVLYTNFYSYYYYITIEASNNHCEEQVHYCDQYEVTMLSSLHPGHWFAHFFTNKQQQPQIGEDRVFSSLIFVMTFTILRSSFSLGYTQPKVNRFIAGFLLVFSPISIPTYIIGCICQNYLCITNKKPNVSLDSIVKDIGENISSSIENMKPNVKEAEVIQPPPSYDDDSKLLYSHDIQIIQDKLKEHREYAYQVNFAYQNLRNQYENLRSDYEKIYKLNEKRQVVFNKLLGQMKKLQSEHKDCIPQSKKIQNVIMSAFKKSSSSVNLEKSGEDLLDLQDKINKEELNKEDEIEEFKFRPEEQRISMQFVKQKGWEYEQLDEEQAFDCQYTKKNQ